MTATPTDVIDRFHAYATGEDDEGRACADIPDEACVEAPRSFLLNTASGACTKLAEQLASPGLVLPWLMAAASAPTAMVGLLAPIKEAGSLLPQLFVSGRIRTIAVRKWVWAGAGFTQAASLALMALAAATLEGASAGAAIVGTLAIFSIASGVGSVAFKDVMAKTIPKGRRGGLLAARATLGGILVVAAGIVIHILIGEREDVAPYVALVLIAAVLWALAATFFAMIAEQPGETKGGRSAILEARSGLRLVGQVRGFRIFLTSRALLASVPLATPFHALYAREVTGSAMSGLAVLVVATGLSQVVSSPFWGRFSDRSSRKVLMVAGVIGASAGALALLLAAGPEPLHNAYIFSSIFVLGAVAHAGCRLGRKTYLTDGAPKDDRPLYVAIANTLMGIVILAAAGFGLMADLIGLPALIAIMAALALLGAVTAWLAPEADRMIE